MSNNENQPLKPCPKCSSTDVGRVIGILPHLIHCYRCKYRELESTWNNRPEEDRLKAKIEVLRDTVIYWSDESARLKAENERLLAQQEEDTGLISDLREKEIDAERVGGENQSLKNEISGLKEETARLKAENERLNDELTDYENEPNVWLEKALRANHKLLAEIERLKAENEELKRRLNRTDQILRDARVELVTEITRLQAENERLQTKLDELKTWELKVIAHKLKLRNYPPDFMSSIDPSRSHIGVAHPALEKGKKDV